ncbi:hypothetical protein OGATHE_004140 [Ogataea polymorpha]|uniref:Secreted protein n=1 Tax=Ogataea polymorpha TaxID=460523 RepID=A0A9P8P612_9ASCO|nr:hypothetical protein OGATHE_004140 [Ogataea polymorpha]
MAHVAKLEVVLPLVLLRVAETVENIVGKIEEAGILLVALVLVEVEGLVVAKQRPDQHFIEAQVIVVSSFLLIGCPVLIPVGESSVENLLHQIEHHVVHEIVPWEFMELKNNQWNAARLKKPQLEKVANRHVQRQLDKLFA